MASMKDVAEGLQILMAASENPDDACSVDAQHDVIYAGASSGMRGLSPTEIEALNRLGWHWDTGVDCWAKFT